MFCTESPELDFTVGEESQSPQTLKLDKHPLS
jgi:hypothetical protein